MPVQQSLKSYHAQITPMTFLFLLSKLLSKKIKSTVTIVVWETEFSQTIGPDDLMWLIPCQILLDVSR
jgi:hypothetical protein